MACTAQLDWVWSSPPSDNGAVEAFLQAWQSAAAEDSGRADQGVFNDMLRRRGLPPQFEDWDTNRTVASVANGTLRLAQLPAARWDGIPAGVVGTHIHYTPTPSLVVTGW
jgi:hypothetical protein